ncbi:hypothetical protein LSH36_875g00000, partial [Paralvinella palmiformis]
THNSIFQLNLFPERLTRRECTVDIGFVLDGSGSIKRNNWKKILTFVEEFQQRIDFRLHGARIAVVSFGNGATVHLRLNSFQNRRQFERAVSGIQYKDTNTNTAAGLRALRIVVFNETNGDRIEVPDVGILITDGVSTWGHKKTIPEAIKLREAGVRMFVIGMGKTYNRYEAAAIASKPTDNYLSSGTFAHMEALLEPLLRRVCNTDKGTFHPAAAVTATYSRLMYYCGFQDYETECNVMHDPKGQFTWKLKKPTGSDDLTSLSSNPEFSSSMCIESGDHKPGEHGTMYLPFGIIGTDVCLRFHYNVHHPTAGTLQIILDPDGQPKWSAQNTGGVWISHRQTVRLKYGQKITSCEDGILRSKDCQLDVGFLIDGSRTNRERGWKPIRSFISEFSRAIGYRLHGTRIAVVTFGYEATVNVKLNAYPNRNLFVGAVYTLYSNYTGENVYTAAGLRAMRTVVFNETNEIPNVIIYLTYGGSLRQRNATFAEASRLKHEGVKIFTIGIGNKYDKPEAEEIASEPAPNHTMATDFRNPKLSGARFASKVCPMYKVHLLYFCGFEEDDSQCTFNQRMSTSYVWIRTNKMTPTSDTGPVSAFRGKYYIYAEATGAKPWSTATLDVPFRITGTSFCFRFHYHMLGENIGQLELLVKDENYLGRRLWSKTGNQGQLWHHAKVPVQLKNGQKLVFRAARGNHKADRADIGLDHIKAWLGSCQRWP